MNTAKSIKQRFTRKYSDKCGFQSKYDTTGVLTVGYFVIGCCCAIGFAVDGYRKIDKKGKDYKFLSSEIFLETVVGIAFGIIWPLPISVIAYNSLVNKE